MVTVLSSFLAAECLESDDSSLMIFNPGRAFSAPGSERERLRAAGKQYVGLPDLVAVLSLYSRQYRGRDYKLSFAFVAPDGEVIGGLQSKDFTWPNEPVERISLRLDGRVRFFEEGGIYRIRFLFNGDPLCEIPLPITWEDNS